jgi:hypothetical protein
MDIDQDRRHEQTHKSKKGRRIKALKGDITQVNTVYKYFPDVCFKVEESG